MYRLLLCIALICIAPVATATSCNDSNNYDPPNAIRAVEVKDAVGRTEHHFLSYRDQYCRAIKIEVLDNKGQLLGFATYSYDDAGVNAHTRLADVTVDAYAPDGSFLFRELMDGSIFDSSGKFVEVCTILELIGRLPDSWRKPYEQRCQDEKRTPAPHRSS